MCLSIKGRLLQNLLLGEKKKNPLPVLEERGYLEDPERF
jgi:hypothetical protein